MMKLLLFSIMTVATIGLMVPSAFAIEDNGDFILQYSTSDSYSVYQDWIRSGQPISDYYMDEYNGFIDQDPNFFNNLVDSMNEVFNLPYDVPIIFDECGYSNAYYNPNNKIIVFCYELVQDIHEITRTPDIFTPTDSIPKDVVEFVIYHEIGHALIDIYDLPILGLEEDVADQMSVYMMMTKSSVFSTYLDARVFNAMQWWKDSDTGVYSDSTFADTHSLSIQRYYNLACWAAGGTTLEKYEEFIPKNRINWCPSEYEKLVSSFDTLLEPYINACFNENNKIHCFEDEEKPDSVESLPEYTSSQDFEKITYGDSEIGLGYADGSCLSHWADCDFSIGDDIFLFGTTTGVYDEVSYHHYPEGVRITIILPDGNLLEPIYKPMYGYGSFKQKIAETDGSSCHRIQDKYNSKETSEFCWNDNYGEWQHGGGGGVPPIGRYVIDAEWIYAISSGISHDSLENVEFVIRDDSQWVDTTVASTSTPIESTIEPEISQPSGGGCLIATAAFGSEMAPQVQFLRELRDNTVMTTQSGTTFMTGFNQFYYSFSPYVADYERENPIFKEAVKVTLTPLLTSLTLLNYVDVDTEEEMLGYGIGIILLNIGMYFVAPAAIILQVKRWKSKN
jgi:hypothetical protein